MALLAEEIVPWMSGTRTCGGTSCIRASRQGEIWRRRCIRSSSGSRNIDPSRFVAAEGTYYKHSYFLAFLPLPLFSSSRPRFLPEPERAATCERKCLSVPCKIPFSPKRTTTAFFLFRGSCSMLPGSSSFSSSYLPCQRREQGYEDNCILQLR